MGRAIRTSLVSHYTAIVSKTKRLLLCGPASVNGIRKLSRLFGIDYHCGGSCITYGAFSASLKDMDITLSEDELKIVFTMLSRTETNVLDPSEFVAALRYHISPLRRVWLRRVWNTFSLNSDGFISIAELKVLFDAEKHFDVINGTRSASEIAAEFESAFNEGTNPDGFLSEEEFQEYYAGVSGNFADDVDFIAMLRGVWLTKAISSDLIEITMPKTTASYLRGFSAYQTIEQKNELVTRMKMVTKMMSVIIDEHRPKVMSDRGLSVRLLGLAFRSADVSGRLFLSVQDFLSSLRLCRLYVDYPEAICALDTNGDASVDCAYYLQLLLPELSPVRYLLLERLWKNLFPVKDSQGRIGIKEFQARFMARDTEEKNDFLNAWDIQRAVRGKVELMELIEWYTPISLKVQLDNDFESLLHEHWPQFGATKQQ